MKRKIKILKIGKWPMRKVRGSTYSHSTIKFYWWITRSRRSTQNFSQDFKKKRVLFGDIKKKERPRIQAYSVQDSKRLAKWQQQQQLLLPWRLLPSLPLLSHFPPPPKLPQLAAPPCLTFHPVFLLLPSHLLSKLLVPTLSFPSYWFLL